MSETTRTILLIGLLLLLVGFMIWTRQNYATNFEDLL
jgi:hypothetical protein